MQSSPHAYKPRSRPAPMPTKPGRVQPRGRHNQVPSRPVPSLPRARVHEGAAAAYLDRPLHVALVRHGPAGPGRARRRAAPAEPASCRPAGPRPRSARKPPRRRGRLGAGHCRRWRGEAGQPRRAARRPEPPQAPPAQPWRGRAARALPPRAAPRILGAPSDAAERLTGTRLASSDKATAGA